MAKTAAERQKEYRARRNEGEGDRRLNSWITVGADLALERLALHNGLTKRAMLERLILDADGSVQAGLLLDSEEWDAYFRGQV